MVEDYEGGGGKYSKEHIMLTTTKIQGGIMKKCFKDCVKTFDTGKLTAGEK